MSRLIRFTAGAALLALAAGATARDGKADPLSTLPGFRIGTAGVLCTAQGRSGDAALKSMFDRAYAITCRDAAAPIGKLYVVRENGADPVAAVAAGRDARPECGQSAQGQVEGLSGVRVTECTLPETKIAYRIYSVARGGRLYLAEGLAGYDSALQLGLRSIVLDRPAEGEVQVAITAAGDPAAFARVQAGNLDADQALAAAYIRNNSGNYAEAAEFFDTLAQREGGRESGRGAEYVANQALQRSNLGNFAEADALFGRAGAAPGASDPVTARLIRNFRAIHQLNQRRTDAALAELAKSLTPFGASGEEGRALAEGYLSPALAARLNGESGAAARVVGVDTSLTPAERAAILDAQALQLQGSALRLQRRFDDAAGALAAAEQGLAAVRGGRIASTAWLRSEVLSEQALLAEARGDQQAAERAFGAAMQVIAVEYPESAALLSAKARLAAYLGRRGDGDRAITLYREIVQAGERTAGSSATLATLIEPYFDLLAGRAASDQTAVADLFAASQVMLRPGVAQTQAVFARELSGGDDEAARMFRESVTLSRDIARVRTQIARLSAAPGQTPEIAAAIVTQTTELQGLERDQTAIQARLSVYPRYRVIDSGTLALEAMQRLLRKGEAYYKLTLVGQDGYAMLITPSGAQAFKVASSRRELEQMVSRLRETISSVENGQRTTFPFDAAVARGLYRILFEPVETGLAGVNHLIFDPDGPLLQLPANLLIAEQAGVDAYQTRSAAEDADPFDFTGIAWLGRDRDVSTAVSPRSFADLRAITPSRGKRSYIGFGENAAPDGMALSTASTRGGGYSDSCEWPLGEWAKPISAAELNTARGIVGMQNGAVVTGTAFSDSAVKAQGDLNDYRVLHFATHGLVTAPRPECPARPALLTSFGDGDSDGLLTFREIYDLRLDADVVILSACDTAGAASISATREAGVSTGGNFALDGLVRAFVGAGGRSVVASHWPVPDDFSATQRLISGMFDAPQDTAMATALRTAQRELMDNPETSHPYYWSGFAIIGDGSRPLVRKP